MATNPVPTPAPTPSRAKALAHSTIAAIIGGGLSSAASAVVDPSHVDAHKLLVVAIVGASTSVAALLRTSPLSPLVSNT